MCSLEVPDIEQAIAAQVDPDEVVVWLVNVEDGPDEVYDFVGDAGTGLPVLLDSDGAVYGGYDRWNLGEDQYAPFPLQVVIDREGTISYMSNQYDAQAVRAAIADAVGP